MNKQVLIAVGFFVIGFITCALVLASANLSGQRSVGAVWSAATLSVKTVLEGEESDNSKFNKKNEEPALHEPSQAIPSKTVASQIPAKPQQGIKKIVPLDEAAIREIESVHLGGRLPPTGEYSDGPPAEDIAFHKNVANLESAHKVIEQPMSPATEATVDQSNIEKTTPPPSAKR